MKAFEFIVYTNNSEVSVDGKLFFFFFLFQQRKKKSLKRIISSIYPDRNILSFLSNGLFVANKLNIGLSIVYYLWHQIRLYFTSKCMYINVQVHLWLLCLVMDYYANIARGWEVGFWVIYKNELCKLWAFIQCINYAFTTRYEWKRWYLQECLFVTWDVFVVRMRIGVLLYGFPLLKRYIWSSSELGIVNSNLQSFSIGASLVIKEILWTKFTFFKLVLELLLQLGKKFGPNLCENTFSLVWFQNLPSALAKLLLATW